MFMKLCTLLEGVVVTGKIKDTEISSLVVDSRTVKKDSLFVLLEENPSLRLEYMKEAFSKGVAVVICPKEDGALGLEGTYGKERILYSKYPRRDYALLSGNWFSNPAKDLVLIGVTGTNGKTTTTHMIKSMLEKLEDGKQRKVGLIGTNENRIGEIPLPASRTTPDPFALHELFREMVHQSCTHVVMEVSSHGLDQERTGGLIFEVGVFTNLTQDHLDYHQTMEEYKEAKSKLFLQCHYGIFNLDDLVGRELAQRQTCHTLTYSENKEYATLHAQQFELCPENITFVGVHGNQSASVYLPMTGGFTLYNALAALVCGLALGHSLDKLSRTLANLSGVKGRLERVDTLSEATIMIDYAHTPNALENILLTTRTFTEKRLFCVFGCGGNRDRSKRSVMGSIAENIADVIVVTSDNPRFEEPAEIISDILLGLDEERSRGKVVKVIENRKEAIGWALSQAGQGDVVLLAGKGHECYQEIKGEQYPFDEREIVSSHFTLQHKEKEESRDYPCKV